MSYRQLTLKDIAKELGTSVSTVSRALKDHHSIGEEMKKRVRDLAREWDYHPNPIAVNLLKKQSNTIGVVIPEIAHHFFSIVMGAIEDTAAKAGYNVMFCLSKEMLSREAEVINTLLNSRVDGLLIAPTKETTDYTHLESVIRKQIPLIFFDRHCECLNVSKVLVDDYKGAYEAVEHLVHTGRKRIAHIAGPVTLSNSKQRLKGYCDALLQFGVTNNEELIVHCDLTKASARASAAALISQKNMPDAILCYNSSIAFEAMLLVKEQGIKIPEQIAFVGFANEPVISYIEPQLTTIVQPAYQMGVEATNLFLSQVRSKGEFKPVIKTLDTELLIRGSSVRQ